MVGMSQSHPQVWSACTLSNIMQYFLLRLAASTGSMEGFYSDPEDLYGQQQDKEQCRTCHQYNGCLQKPEVHSSIKIHYLMLMCVLVS